MQFTSNLDLIEPNYIIFLSIKNIWVVSTFITILPDHWLTLI